MTTDRAKPMQAPQLAAGETTRLKHDFLDILATHGDVYRACMAIRAKPWWLFAWRKKDPIFAAAWKDAQEVGDQYLESVARERALEGTRKPLYHQGAPVLVYRTKTDENGQPILDEEGREIREIVRDEKGQPVQAHEAQHDSALMRLMLAGAMPHKYGTTRQELTGKDGADLLPPQSAVEDAQRVAFVLAMGVEAKLRQGALEAQEPTFDFQGDLV